MNRLLIRGLLSCVTLPGAALGLTAETPDLARQEPNTWVKRSPLADTPPSPRLGYESSLGYDPKAKVLIRWGGHNQGGGGEQNAETWTFDPLTARWTLKETNDAPPGVCCASRTSLIGRATASCASPPSAAVTVGSGSARST